VGTLPRVARLYITAVVVAGVLAVARGPLPGIAWPDCAALAALVVLAESAATFLRSTRHVSRSPISAATLAAVVLLGPAGAAIVGASTGLKVRRLPAYKRVFNAGLIALSAYLAGRVFLLAGGEVGAPGPSSFPGIIGPFAAAAAANLAVNLTLLHGALWLAGERAAEIHASLDPWLNVAELGYGAFGLLIAALWSILGPFTSVLVLAPLFVGRWATAQFAAQRRAYEATVSVLCRAVETKDLYTRGHCERVSRGSVMIAREIGMRGDRVEAIRYAGMLHDVGKLGVPTQVLQKTGKLTDEEYAAIQLHPMHGLDIVREIGFLDEALAGIMHHHERIDGCGYPMGLAGNEIPEFARVLAVADAFDAMTSTRSYRGARAVEEAIAELRKWSGAQFDPAFVDAFVAAVKREGWQCPDPPEPQAPATGDPAAAAAQGHDDQAVRLGVIGSL
jgi:HD superfamily phosphohydrolase YqeK